jgi:predicted nucleic acid-binding protein
VKYLLDTCVVSALRKPEENPALVRWISGVEEGDLYLSAVTIGELEKGVSLLPEGRKKSLVRDWVLHALTNRFGRRILDVDAPVAARWGALLGENQKKGRSLPILDALIAATALVHDCTLVTRNLRDFRALGASLFNPWETL